MKPNTMVAPFTFRHPFTCMIAGPSQSGKTEFTKKLLARSSELITPPPAKIYWCYGQNNPAQFQDIKTFVTNKNPHLEIEFHHNIPTQTFFDELDTSKNNLIVFDDLMTEIGKSKDVCSIFTRKSHHQNLSVIVMVQNLYHQNTYMTDIHRNVKYLVLFKNPRDKLQIRYLSRQMNIFSDSLFVSKAYEQATLRPHGYLLIDCDQRTTEDYRILSGIFFPEELPVRYIP